MKSNQSSRVNQFTSLNSDFFSLKSGISAKKITQFLLCLVGIQVLFSVVSQTAVFLLEDYPLNGLRLFIAQKLSVNGEQSIPALYSSISLFFCGVLFWIIGQYKQRLKDKYTSSWKWLFVVFTYLALDELLSFHEYLSTPFRKLGFDGILHYAWVIPGLIAVGIFCAAFYRFFQHLPRFLKRLILLAIFTFVGGAIFVEIAGGYYRYLYGRDNLGYYLIATIEESMEMIGVVILIHGLLTYIQQLGIDAVKLNFHVTDETLRDLK
ncbi:MAG: hypothetical protein WBA77_14435 [Microcoleaceae cyanobacterium]